MGCRRQVFRHLTFGGAIVLILLLAATPPRGAGAAPLPPPNDDHASAHVIAGPAGSLKGSNEGATKESGEPDHAAGASVWYRWTAPSTGTFTFDTHGSSFDTLLGVYTGDAVDKLTEIAFSDNSQDATSELSFAATAGATYSILVDGSGGQTGEIVLTWQAAGPPPNDSFAVAQTLTGDTGTVAGTNVSATKEPHEPAHAGDAGGASVWFTWHAPADGTYRFEVSADFGGLLAIYRGDALISLQRIGGDGPGVSSQVSLAAAKGTTYRIAVDGSAKSFSGMTGRFTLSWWASPPNDHFADAHPIGGAAGQIAGNNDGATREKDEPFHAGTHGLASVWYRWVAPANGPAVYYTTAASFDTQVAVYTGTALNSLTPIAANDDRGSGLLSEVAFPAVAGTEYWIAIDGEFGQNSLNSGPFVLGWTPPPPNDHFANAQPIGGSTGQVAGSNHGATREPGEPLSGEASIWYRFAAPVAGSYAFDTTGSDFEAVVRFYGGSALGSLAELGSASSRGAVLKAAAGTSYYLVVDGRKRCPLTCLPADVGNLILKWTLVSPPANDDFAAAQPIAGPSGRFDGSNVAATKQSGEPNHAGAAGGASLWLVWTAPASGSYTFDIGESDIADRIAIYTGDAIDRLTRVDDGITPSSRPRTRVTATSGQTYRIAVDEQVGRGGSVVLTWAPTPANDDFAAARTIAGPAGQELGTSIGATREPLEPSHAGGPIDTSTWYRWVAPARGAYSFEVIPETHPETTIAVYTGSHLDGLLPVGGYDRGSLVFSAQGGQEYLIAAAATCRLSPLFSGVGFLDCSRSGPYTLRWEPVPPPGNDIFAAAESLKSPAGALVADIGGATKEPGEPDHGGRNGAASVWYTWTAPTDGLITFDTLEPGNIADRSLLAVYTGDGLNTLQAVPRFNDPGLIDLGRVNDPADLRNNQVTFQARAGATYRVTVDRKALAANSGDRRPTQLRWGPPPANDQVAAARAIAGPAGQEAGTILGATREPSEPFLLGNSSVWYSWTAPANGSLNVAADGLALQVATGNSPGTLTPVSTTVSPSDSRAILFEAAKGTTYQIGVGGLFAFTPFCSGECTFHGVIQSEFSLDWQLRPVNDFFLRAQSIGGERGSIRTSNVAATNEPGEPDHSGRPGGASIWYQWTAPADDTITFDTVGSDIDVLLAVYTGPAITNLQGVGDGKFRGGPSRVQLRAIKGQTYFIALDGLLGATGAIALNWAPPPPNDNFATAAPFDGPDGRLEGSTRGATREPNEPWHAFDPGFASIWYAWTAPEDGIVRFDTTGGEFTPLLAVYTGNSLDTLTEIAATWETGPVAFQARRGVTYRIVIDGPDDTFCDPCPPNEGRVMLAWTTLRVAIGNAEVAEGDGPPTQARFPVAVSFPPSAGLPISVSYATADGSAEAPADYEPAGGVLSFSPGELTKTVTIAIVGDLRIEPAETFSVRLTTSQGALIDRGTATGTVKDDDGPPVIRSVAAPIDPVVIGEPVTLTVAFTDPDLPDAHSVTIEWEDGTSGAGTVTEANGSGTARGVHTYATPGLYTVRVTVADTGGGAATASPGYVIVVDPSGPSVNGGGWIEAGPGDQVHLAFTARYREESAVPTGTIELRIPGRDLSFSSTGWHWLAAQGDRAVLRGSGTINGKGDYVILLSLADVDGARPESRDLVRVKIWERAGQQVIYDTQPVAPDAASPTTQLGGGALTIHPDEGRG